MVYVCESALEDYRVYELSLMYLIYEVQRGDSSSFSNMAVKQISKGRGNRRINVDSKLEV